MKNTWKKAGIISGAVLGGLYVLFLAAPMFLTGVTNSYAPQISKIVEDSCGFKLKLDNLRIVTTPKLTAGIKIGHTDVMLPTGESFLTADNAQVKISLLPFLIKKIELDAISAENINTTLKIQKDGKFLLENYIPQSEESAQTQAAQPVALPFGLKLSNHLPNISVKNYNIAFVDIPTHKKYSIAGNEAKISDFILDKSIKAKIDGKVTLDNRSQFNYDIKLFNKIMPELNLNDLVFNPQPPEIDEKKQPVMVNVIDVFKALYTNQLTADVNAKLKVAGTLENMDLNGNILVDKLGIAVDGQKLPDSSIGMEFKGNKVKMNTKLYSAKDETTQILGDFTSGKHPKIDLNLKSNAQINSLFAIVDSVAKSLNYNDLDTLSATGAIDADFNLKSDLKKVNSSGYFKIPQASINYPLYNIAIKDINANIDFANNMVNIKNAGFSVFNQPLKVYGTIKQDATADLHVIADKLQLKGLIAAAGQVGLLKDNDFISGTVSVDAALKGRLDKAQPKVDISLDNINVKNKPSNTSVTLANADVSVKTDGKNTDGNVDVNRICVINPMASVSVPVVKVKFGQDDIIISDTYLLLNNSRIDIAGKVTDYMTKKLHFDIKANGNLIANDIKNMIPPEMRSMVRANGKLPLNIDISGNDKAQEINFKLTANPSNYVNFADIDELKGQNMTAKSLIKISGDTVKLIDTAVLSGNTPLVTLSGGVNNIYSTPRLDLNALTNKQLGVVIPGFSDSKMLVKGNINIGASVNNPTLSGAVSIPLIKIPSMAFTLNDMNLNLSGVIANGKGTVKKLQSGGITAENLAADFSLKNYNILYLKNITGDAFSGKVAGNVAYNIAKNSAAVDFKGSGLNALKAIEGAAGLKNALSGTLGFNADVSLNLANETEMMRSLKGKVSFDIADGAFMNIGRLENLLFADNITSNSVMKAAVNSIVSLPTIKNTAHFKTITGDMSFNNGWANLTSIKTSGPSMSYYITGRYNLLNATANVAILGRLSADVVKVLGPVGELSVDKLTSYLPKFGHLTSTVIKTMTTNPRGEKVSEIPVLSSGNTNYKDFKVSFNGGVDSKSSVKSFKWLSTCDTSAIEGMTLKEQIQTTKQAVQEAHQNRMNEFKNSLEEARKQNEANRQQMQNIQNNLKNLFKSE